MKAIEQKRAICFPPNLDKPTHEGSINCPAGSFLEFDKEIQQRVSGAAPTTWQARDERPRCARTGIPYPRGSVLITPSTKSDDSPTQEAGGVEDVSKDSALEDYQIPLNSLTEEQVASMESLLADVSSKDRISSWLSRTVTPPIEEKSLQVQKMNVKLGNRADADLGPSYTAFDSEICCCLLNHPRQPDKRLAARN